VNTKNRSYSVILAILAFLLLPASALADGLNVLWYVYTPYQTTSANSISGLASSQHWNVTYWGPGSSSPSFQPNFSSYNVLVTQSWSFPNVQGQDPQDLSQPDYSGLLNNGSAIDAARGYFATSRTVITGLDPDFHYLYGRGYDDAGVALAAMINWAGNGSRLGMVALADYSGYLGGYQSPYYQWWFQSGSPLHDELSWVELNFNNDCQPGHQCIVYRSPENSTPQIVRNWGPMTGVTDGNLADWGESYHSFFSGGQSVLPSGYYGFVDANQGPSTNIINGPYIGWSLIATGVPEPGALLLLAAGLGALGMLRRRRG
jgi:hypothetical protein